MMAVLAPLFAAGSAFFLSLVGWDVLRRAFAQYEQRYLARSIRDLGAMFLFIDRGQMLRLNLCALVLLSAAGFSLGGWLCAALAAVPGFFAPGLLVVVHRRRRVRRFEAQLSGALQQLSGALRAGFTLQQAVEQVGRESEAPLRHEFALFTKEVKLGAGVDEALAAMAKRVGSDELDLLATSTAIARQLGGNLAELFESIAATVRERFRLEGKIAALTSQGKLQGIVVASLPVFVGVFLQSYRADLFAPMFESAFGYVLVAAVLLLQSVGFLAIRRVVSIDV